MYCTLPFICSSGDFIARKKRNRSLKCRLAKGQQLGRKYMPQPLCWIVDSFQCDEIYRKYHMYHSTIQESCIHTYCFIAWPKQQKVGFFLFKVPLCWVLHWSEKKSLPVYFSLPLLRQEDFPPYSVSPPHFSPSHLEHESIQWWSLSCAPSSPIPDIFEAATHMQTFTHTLFAHWRNTRRKPPLRFPSRWVPRCTSGTRRGKRLQQRGAGWRRTGEWRSGGARGSEN